MTEEDIADVLSGLADESSPCARVFRHHEDLQVAVLPTDFYTALKSDGRVVVRVQIDGVAPIDCRHRDGGIEFTTEVADTGSVSRHEFLDKVSSADTVSLVHHRESQFATGSEDTGNEVRADGGQSSTDTEQRGGE